MPVEPNEPRKTASGKDIPPAEYRVATAQRLLLDDCMSYGDTRDYLMKQYEVSHATAERDIAAARKQIAEDAEQERPMLRARETNRLNRIACKAESTGKLDSAISAIRSLAKINGLEVQVIVAGGASPEQQALLNAAGMTPHQRQTRIDELRGRLEQRTSTTEPKSAVDPPTHDEG